ncbi:MAG TPA: alpha-2-macroglobulin family protein [Gammaproteobacteria bacterium]|nr:alpha-2-macroglobulin family protein [Gammaproteobacteria bacterium]
MTRISGARIRSTLRLLALLAVAGAALAQSGAEPASLKITRVTPSGRNVPEGRQIVFQFDRAVVPIGRMDRTAAEIPIEITPPLACQWRWLDPSALACELADGDQFRPATVYMLVVKPGIRAQDGATVAGESRYTFATETPTLGYPQFATWRSPGTPVVRAVFNQPVSQSSVRAHVFMTVPGQSARRVELDVAPDTEQRELPRYLRLPGERAFVDLGERRTQGVDDQPTETRGETARRVWLLSPASELPPDATVRLMVEPGLEPAVGTERGVENRTALEFATFPELAFLGVRCQDLTGESIELRAGAAAGAAQCNPLGSVGLAFSAPVLGSEVKEHVEITPDLAQGRTDYDPWANRGDYSMLRQPHERGREYIVWLPERLKAAEPYRARVPRPADGPKDEFGRTLAAPVDFAFATSHRPPGYTLEHSTAVLEQGIDSEVPLFVTNLDSYTVRYRKLTAAGAETALVRKTDLPKIADVQYGVPLHVRELLGGAAGAVYGQLETSPPLERRFYRPSLFAQVTPYQLHVKVGHYNTLVWATELASGTPLRGARVSIYVDSIAQLRADVAPLASAQTDASGVALLAGTRELDPKLALMGYGCRSRQEDECLRLFVRVDGPQGLALLPLDYRFEVNTYRASGFNVFPSQQPAFGHLHAWGTTAQGVYRAGDTIDYKLYVRDQDNESLVAAPLGPYELAIVDPKGETVQTIPGVMLSAFGAYSGSYAIPESGAVGWYQFKLTARFGATAPPVRANGAPERDEVVRFPLRVLVSDFTPSPFGVRTTLNGDLFQAGDEVAVETRASLFSGGPYADADARVTAQIVPRPFVSEHPVAAPFRFDTGMQPAALTVSQSMGRVDSQGELVQTFRIDEDVGNRIVYGTLSVEGAVRDDRGKYVAGGASADFVAVDRLVGLRSTKWVFQEDQPAAIQYLVVDGKGTPTAGTDVTIAVQRLDTKAARVKGAGNAYLTQFIEDWVDAGSCSGRSAATPLTCTFTPDTPGRFRLTASVHDTRGRPHTTTLDTWVVGKGRVVWSGENDDALEIVPEKTTYRVGDTARYLVKNPYPGARALVTIERYGVLKQWVETLDGSTPVIQFKVTGDYLPGFFVSVLAMSPRVAAPPTARDGGSGASAGSNLPPEAGEVDLGKPAFKLGYVAVPVEDPYKQIDVSVKVERAVYKPRETVRVRVKAAPREREQREPIEVAVAVLDESVLDLIQGGTSYFDPYKGFYSLDGLDVRNFGLLTRLVGRQKIDLKGASPGGDGGAALSMRSVFKYVSYWNPSLTLDARGNGTFEFEVPDNLTGWRVLVLAATPTDRLGLGEASFKVNQPTEVRPVMPNQVTEGDRFQAGFSVMNRTDKPRDLRVTLDAAGGVAAPAKHEETVHLEPYARATVQMPVEAAAVAANRNVATGKIAFTATARDASDGDRVLHELVVSKRRSLETAASYGSLDGASATEALRFPKDIRPDAGDVGVVLSPSVLGNIDGAFRYLRDYPYLSWEQQLTKGVMAAHFSSLEAYLPSDLEWPGAEELPASTLAQAASFQAPNGGMTYWVAQDQYVSPYLSAYTALAFGWLRDGGYAIPEAVEAKLDEYLDGFLKRDVFPDFYTRGMASTVRAVALAALAKRGKAGLADLQRYREHVQYMSLFGKAHFLQAALAVPGAESIARETEDAILASSVRSGGKIAFNEVLDDGYLRLSATPLDSQCAVLSVMSAGGLRQGEAATSDGRDVAPAIATRPPSLAGPPFELVRAITQARGSRDHWENTQENMFCMAALLDYSRKYEAATPDLRVTASVGGTPLGAAEFKSVRDAAVTLARPIGPADPGTDATLTVERSGAGRLYYSARMTYAPTEAAAVEQNAGVDLHKELSVQRDGRWVLLASPATVKRGELVRVDLYVSLPTARNFLVVDDPVPGGLEPVNRDLANASLVDAAAGEFQAAGGSLWFRFTDWIGYGASRWSFYHQELRHDSVRFYSEYLPPGNYHLSYSATAIAEGEFGSAPARAVEMYDPDVYGTSLPATLTVEAAP